MAKGAKRAKKRKVGATFDTPTDEAFQHGDFERAGVAYRRVPAIDTLKKRGILTDEDHKALARFRDLWIACERSEMRSCLDDRPKGGGNGPAPALLRAQSDLNRLECALGALAPIARAVAGNDVSLAQWAISQSGCKGDGIPVCLPKTKALADATMDIKFAAARLKGELAA